MWAGPEWRAWVSWVHPVTVRAIWKGAVSFGLVNVPVRLYSATENHDLSFHQVRRSDGSRIRYKRVAQTDGEEVPYKEIAKAYQTEDGKSVILTDEDFESLPNRSSKEIAVEKFVPIEQIDPILYDKPYYIEPDGMGAKAYGLLREALRESERVAVVTVSVRTRMTMAVLRVIDDVIVLQTLLWPDEVRDSGALNNLDEVSNPKDSEVAMARMLIDSMAGDFELEEHEDDYQIAVEALVKSKIEGGDVTESPDQADEEESGEVVDLLAALQRSVDRAKASRGEDPEETTSSAPRTSAAKKSTSKKSATQKSTAQKSAGTKSAAKKSADTKSATKKTTAKKTTAKNTTAKKSSSGSSDKKAG
nr:Ku protein [Ornithinimicrobium cryptoxanthini]